MSETWCELRRFPMYSETMDLYIPDGCEVRAAIDCASLTLFAFGVGGHGRPMVYRRFRCERYDSFMVKEPVRLIDVVSTDFGPVVVFEEAIE